MTSLRLFQGMLSSEAAHVCMHACMNLCMCVVCVLFMWSVYVACVYGLSVCIWSLCEYVVPHPTLYV